MKNKSKEHTLTANKPETGQRVKQTRKQVFLSSFSCVLSEQEKQKNQEKEERKREEEEARRLASLPQEDIALECLDYEEDRFLNAAVDCGYIPTFQTKEELFEELKYIEDFHLLSTWLSFEKYAETYFAGHLPNTDPDLLKLKDFEEFKKELEKKTNYSDTDGNICYIFEI